MVRIRINYQKTDPLRYTGHLDLHKIWERFFRRAQISLAYTQGFHPQPKMNQALPLPLGITSKDEILDIWLMDDRFTIIDIEEKIRNTPQPGVVVNFIEVVDLCDPKIQNIVSSAEYHVELHQPILMDSLEDLICSLLEQNQVTRVRRGKSYDLRPLIINMSPVSSNESNNHSVKIYMHLTARPGATGRPDEVIAALGLDPHSSKVERIKIHLQI